MLVKQDLIDCLCGMYKEWKQIDKVPSYIVESWNNCSVISLVDDIKIWRVKHPEIYANNNPGILF